MKVKVNPNSWVEIGRPLQNVQARLLVMCVILKTHFNSLNDEPQVDISLRDAPSIRTLLDCFQYFRLE